jgi:Uma2 family endonuclease
MLTLEKNKYTAADYELLEDGAPFQLINYDLIMSPSPTPLHQRILLKLASMFLKFMEETTIHKGEFFIAPLDVKFDDGNIYQPDALYIAEHRKAELIKDRIEGAPDLVIEIWC